MAAIKICTFRNKPVKNGVNFAKKKKVPIDDHDDDDGNNRIK